jgi:hypothetical protein
LNAAKERGKKKKDKGKIQVKMREGVLIQILKASNIKKKSFSENHRRGNYSIMGFINSGGLFLLKLWENSFQLKMRIRLGVGSMIEHLQSL